MTNRFFRIIMTILIVFIGFITTVATEDSDIEQMISDLADEIETVEDNGDFIVEAKSSRYGTDVKKSFDGLASQISTDFNNQFKLPKGNVFISFEDCGTVNAFYDPQNAKIIMCYELFQTFFEFYSTPEDAVKAFFFVFYHELGHALVDQWDLPVLGKEEDDVDGMATRLIKI
ncbi:DUF4344 domain-containing metallopeptidase [Candidatus Parabeggiatoa sp. HSG14]|uniref:DUF4344 domain-containing metallopeptidase n=1 Tax=Candidatus Parabeggiatoa sp. HSG14 TaxID=3055593 RepID=UPI0025A8E3B4|nr:DUF4344 domain-containing metallopeptidase [Thiotrichales bacterium HSG14]